MAFVALLPSPLLAQPEGVLSAQLLQGGRMADGRAIVAVVIDLAPGWKTYWRSPGQGGLPPEFDWRASQNLGDVTYFWPVPQVFGAGDAATIGYEGRLVLPLAIAPQNPTMPTMLNAEFTFGICKDICMPAEVSLTAPLAADAPPQPIIADALASQPMTAQMAGAQSWDCISHPIKDGVQVTLQLAMPAWDSGAVETLVVEHRDRGIWASPAAVQRTGDRVTAVFDLVPPQAKPFDWAGDDLRITILAAGKAAELQGCPTQ